MLSEWTSCLPRPAGRLTGRAHWPLGIPVELVGVPVGEAFRLGDEKLTDIKKGEREEEPSRLLRKSKGRIRA